MGGLLHLVLGVLRPRPVHSLQYGVPNVTAHLSTVSVPITVLLYDGLLLCGFSVAIKELILAAVLTKVKRA